MVKETFDQLLKACSALLTAAETSDSVATGTRATTSCVAGLRTSNQVSVVERSFSPLMMSGISLIVIISLSNMKSYNTRYLS